MYEAASLDGANRMQRIWFITLPQLIPTFFVLLIMGIGLNMIYDKHIPVGNMLPAIFMPLAYIPLMGLFA